MNIKIFIALAFSMNVYAHNLNEIIHLLEASNTVASLTSKARTQIAQNNGANTYAPPEISLGLVHAESSQESHTWTEYAVGISQTLDEPFASTQKLNVAQMKNNSVRQKLKHQKHVLELHTSSKYYATCIAKELQTKAQILLEGQETRLKQIHTAYTLGEVSKKDYLFYKLDFLKRKQDVNRYSRSYLVALSKLQENVDNETIKEVACNDLQGPKRALEFNAVAQHGEVKELGYQENAAASLYGISKNTVDSLSYWLEYEKEYDTNRYIVGVSIPFSFATSKKEKLQGEYFHSKQAISQEKDALIAEIQAQKMSSSLRLANYFDAYILLKREILPLSEELYTLSNFAYTSGEGTVLESITAARAYQENVLEMLKVKEKYYKEFFDLHIIADLDFGDTHE